MNEEAAFCPLCGSELKWEDCPHCGGLGYWDAHDDDPVNFDEGEEWIACDVCEGLGGWWVCPNGEQHAQE